MAMDEKKPKMGGLIIGLNLLNGLMNERIKR